jgi:hypothetical protein
MFYVLFFLMAATATGFLFRLNALVGVTASALILSTFAALRASDVSADFMVFESRYR